MNSDCLSIYTALWTHEKTKQQTTKNNFIKTTPHILCMIVNHVWIHVTLYIIRKLCEFMMKNFYKQHLTYFVCLLILCEFIVLYIFRKLCEITMKSLKQKKTTPHTLCMLVNPLWIYITLYMRKSLWKKHLTYFVCLLILCEFRLLYIFRKLCEFMIKNF